MTTDVHDRLRRGLAEYAEAVPVDPPAPAALTGAATPAGTRRAGLTRWAVPAVAALAVALVVGVGFLVRPGGAPVTDRVTTTTSVRFLGWRSPERLLVYGPVGDADVVTEVDRAGADPTRVSVVDRDGARDDRQIDFVQLAYTLLPDLVVRPAGAPDHGPWPTWLRVTVAVATAVLLGGVAVLVRQRRRRVDPRLA